MKMMSRIGQTLLVGQYHYIMLQSPEKETVFV